MYLLEPYIELFCHLHTKIASKSYFIQWFGLPFLKKSIYKLFQMENLVIPYLTHLYFANNPKSILHQIPPFYVKQFSVLEYLYIFETHL